MTDQTERGEIHSTTNFHLYGPVTASPNYRASDRADVPSYGGNYGYVNLAAGDSLTTITVFICDRRQAETIAAAFWALSTQFPPTPGAEPAADVAHECGTPASQAMDTSDYPVPMTVSQRDPADPESWVFRCGGDHAQQASPVIGGPCGWQSPDYASEDDALIAAADHARAMHDGGLPNELAERAAAAETAAAERMAPSGPDAEHSSDGGFRYPVRHK